VGSVSTHRYQTTQEVARFGLVGVINTLVDYVLFIAFTVVFSIPLSRVWLAKYPSSAIAMIVSYVLNRRYVFRSRQRNVRAEMLRFFTTTLVGVFVIQNLLTQFFSSEFQFFGDQAYRFLGPLGFTESFTIKTVAFGLATIASLTWNYLTYKYWAFRPTDEDGART